MISEKLLLSPEEVREISSPYLQHGRAEDVWEIKDIEIEDKFIRANIRMKSFYQSPTDNNGFHLSPFSTLEFVSQLNIIYGHIWAGADKKTREAWMLESNVACKEPIRSTENIHVEMEFKS